MISFFSWVHSIPLCICGIYIFFIIHVLRDIEVVSMIWPAWIGVCVSFWIRVVSGYTPRSRISGPYGNSSFLRSCHAILHSGCTHLPSYLQRRRVSFSPFCLFSLSLLPWPKVATVTSFLCVLYICWHIHLYMPIFLCIFFKKNSLVLKNTSYNVLYILVRTCYILLWILLLSFGNGSLSII